VLQIRELSLFILLLSSLTSACSAPAPRARSLRAETDFLATIGADRLSSRILIAPIEANYKPIELTEPPVIADQAAIQSATETHAGALPTLAYYQPSLTDNELKSLSGDSKSWFSYLFEEASIDTISLEGLDRFTKEDLANLNKIERIKALCVEAENRGGELLAVIEIVANQLSYKGPDQGALSLDLWMTFFFFPLNGYVDDELFEFRRQARVSLYDVRSPQAALHSYEVDGFYQQSLEEWQHGFIFLNGYKAWRGVPIQERFDNDNWQRVHAFMSPGCQLEFQKKFILELRTTVRDIFNRPEIQAKLRDGSPDQARLYTICIGQNTDKTRFAEADAQTVHKFLLEQAKVMPAHAWLATGDVTREDVLKKIDSLSIKSVDRVLFFFAGQGFQNKNGQSLCLTGSQSISLGEISDGFIGRPVKQIAFILDTSFGASRRSQLYGGRTRSGSLSALPKRLQERYLGPLIRSLRWRVLCAVPHDGTASEVEDRGHGLLTYLLLEQLRLAKDAPTLDAIEAAIESRYKKISQGIMGSPYKPVARVRPAARGFRLTSQ
jgi:hypothetical protein